MKIRRKILTLLLSMVLLCGVLPTAAFAEGTLPPGLSAASVAIGTGSTLRSSTTEVGFGGQRWYVVGFNGVGINKGVGTITLLAADAMGTSVFSASSNQYQGSSLQTAVNALPVAYDMRERAAMVSLTLDEVAGTQPTGQTIWALGKSEAEAISSDVLKTVSELPWWLRTNTSYYNPYYVNNGAIASQYGAPVSTVYGVRPAIAVSLGGVLFATPIAGAKDGAVGTMTAISPSREIKFTMLDSNTDNLDLSITDPPASINRIAGSTLNLEFSGAKTGADKFVSCILVSQADNMVKYYAKLSTAASGTLTIPFPAGMQAGTYSLLIFNEQVAQGNRSDYASAPVNISVTVTGSGGANNAPRLKTGIGPTGTAMVSVGSPYTLRLTDIFEDPDGNPLSYKVSVNSGTAVAANVNYSFTPQAAGPTTLSFTANDGALDSPSHLVLLTATTVFVSRITVRGEGGATSIGMNGEMKLYLTIEPENATNKEYGWTYDITGGKLINLDRPSGSIDFANMLRLNGFTTEGTITVTATAKDGTGTYGQLTLNVLQYVVASINVTSASNSISVGSPVQLQAAVQPIEAQQEIIWSISQGVDKASITPAGLLTATGVGSITVRATATDGSAVYGEKTLQAKHSTSAPGTPTLSSRTATSVTLNSIAGAEYSKDLTSWQDSTTFSNLSYNTPYNFYARLKETDTNNASPTSGALSVTTNKPILEGTVTVDGVFKYESILAANTTGLSSTPSAVLGTLSYQWTRAGSIIVGANGTSYTLMEDDIGQVINVTVTTSNCVGSVSSTNTVQTAKADPSYTVPAGLTALCGQTLSEVALPAGFSWEDAGTTSVGSVGSNNFTVTFTPSDTANYNSVTGITVSISVSDITNNAPTAKLPVPALSVVSGSAISFIASEIAQDADNDPLSIVEIRTHPDAAMAIAVLDSATVTITGVSEGSTSVTVNVSDGSDTVSVTVPISVTAAPGSPVAPSITTQPSHQTITSGQTATLSIMAAGDAPLSYQWKKDDVDLSDGGSINGASTATLTITNAQLADAGSYTCYVSNAAGNTISSAATLIVNTVPILSAGISPSTVTFDIEPGNQADVTTTITWNDAATVTDVVYGTVQLASPADYTINGNRLTILAGCLESFNLSAGDTVRLEISFDVGDSVALTVIAIRSFTPGSDATLSNLTVGGSTVNGFVSGTYTYNVMLPHGSMPGGAAATVSAVPSDPMATINITQAASLPGNATVLVTSEDTMTIQTYTVVLSVNAAPSQTNSLIITSGTGGSITTGSSGNYEAGTVINLNATPSPGYSFNEWASIGGGTFGSTTSARTTFIMPAGAATITASFTHDGSGGGSGSSTPVIINYNAKVLRVGASGILLPVNVNINSGIAAVDLGTSEGDIFTGEGNTAITIPSIPGVNTYTLGIFASSLSDSEGKGSLSFSTGEGSITIPSNMLSGIPEIEGKKAGITIGQGDKSSLPEDVKTAIGDRPLVQLTLTIDGRQTDWNNPGAPVMVSIPYTPTPEELANPESIVIWYLDGSGNVVAIPNGRYNPATGRVTFFTTHFSDYAVAYVQKTFSDLGGVEWARKAIEDMASKGIISETGNGTFYPSINITRADYMVMLINTLGLTVDFKENFDDVKPDAYYYNAVGIAKKLGIAVSSGNNRFNPTESISNQDMMVLAVCALEKYMGLKAVNDNTVLDMFSDRGDIAEYAVNSLATLVNAGLIESSENMLKPCSLATRAEAAVFLYSIYNEYPHAPVIPAFILSRLTWQTRIDTALNIGKAIFRMH